VREGGGRLIEDQDAGVGTERACDLDQLALGSGERAGFGLRGNIGTDAFE
jgi:hypothetical protein